MITVEIDTPQFYRGAIKISVFGMKRYLRMSNLGILMQIYRLYGKRMEYKKKVVESKETKHIFSSLKLFLDDDAKNILDNLMTWNPLYLAKMEYNLVDDIKGLDSTITEFIARGIKRH